MTKDGSTPLSPPSWGLVLVRIAVGFIVMRAGWGKISQGVGEELVTGTKEAFAAAPSYLRWWGEHVVLPHPKVFAQLIAWGELLGGAALFVGALTRPAGLALALMFANFYFVGPEGEQPLVLLLAAGSFAVFLSSAGERCGVDGILASKLPRWLTW